MPARARVTPRAKASTATEGLDKARSVAAVASDYRCGWHSVHDHVVAVADTVLAAEPAPVMVLGIDETRRGKAKWATDATRVAELGGPLGHRTDRQTTPPRTVDLLQRTVRAVSADQTGWDGAVENLSRAQATRRRSEAIRKLTLIV